MCNGSGSVRTEIQKVEVMPKHLIDLNRVPATIHARVNKNEFLLFSRHIIKYIVAADYQRASNSFNYLIELTSRTTQQPEVHFKRELQRLRKEYIDDMVTSQEGVELNLSEDFSSTVTELTKRFERLYDAYF